MASGKQGFAVRFDALGDFLVTQGIYLQQDKIDELAFRYTGNSHEARTQKVMMSFSELE